LYSAQEPRFSEDAHHAADLIRKKLIRDNVSPDKILRFSNLYSRLLAEPVLQQKWAVLYLLYILADTEPPSILREATASTQNRIPSNHSTPKPAFMDHFAPRDTQDRQFVVNSPAFNEAFSNPGLLKLPTGDETRSPRTDRPMSRHRKDKLTEESSAQPSPVPQTYITYEAAKPTEAAILRDLPFILQGLSTSNLTFSDPSALRLPTTLPVPIVSLLHTLAEPCLLYKGLSEFVDSEARGLIGQSFRSALGQELRSYLKLVATLEGQIRRALAQLDDSQPRQGIGKAGVTLKRCVYWTREATMGLRLMSQMVEGSKGKKGGQLISVIHSFSLNHGDPFVVAFAERLLGHVTRPFYDMLRQWIYDGELSDPYLEFFVAEQHDMSDSDPDGRKGGASSVWEDKYKLISDLIPSIITEQFANKVFLIGKSLNFIRHGCHDGSWVESYSKSASKELRYGDTATLETSIDEAYKTTMARLIDLMATKFNLFEHLAALKKYLLLGAGDFIAVLMESLSSNLDRPANTQYRHTLTAQLEHAVRNSNAQHDSKQVLSRLDSRMLELSHGEIGWDVFTLEYKISPPVDVIVTPYGSKQYLKVFNFLWRVKRVEFALGSTWRRCMTGARSVLAPVEDKVGADWKAARCAMAEMIHFVNQLQYYILFEVIEASWNELQQAMKKPESTLDDLIAAHAAYLNSITRKGLLGSSAVDFTSQLHELLKIMLSYKDSVDQLYSTSVAEFTRRQDISAKIETRTAAGKWGITEKDGIDSEGRITPLLSSKSDAHGRHDTSSPVPSAPAGLDGGDISEEGILLAQRKRLRELADRFKRRVTALLSDLIAQPDPDMRWLAMVMNFNDVYQPVRRRSRASGKSASTSQASGGSAVAAGAATVDRAGIRDRARERAGGRERPGSRTDGPLDKGKGKARS
jgi:gamma-tubulin complex component 3